MSINVNTLVRVIEKSSNSSLTPMEILEYAKAIDQLNIGSVITVARFSNLPDIDNVDSGALYYVLTDKQLYISNKETTSWRSLLAVFQSKLTAWGSNLSFKLGIQPTTSFVCTPTDVVGNFADWCQVSAASHTAAIRTNGTLWTWGSNLTGQLGDNTVVDKSSPVSVVGGFTDWCQVAAGGTHTAAIRSNGTLWTWGCNANGQLGDNTTVSKSSPVSVVGGFTDWRQVSAGNYNTAAVKINGTIWTWGLNNGGQLGDNTAVAKSSPASVVGGFTDWCQVFVGRRHMAAIRTNGTIWTWGDNLRGQLGDNSAGFGTSKSSPVSVVGGFTDWCQVSAGHYHNAAIRTNGTLWSWGENTGGKLGDNTAVAKSSPVSVVGGFTDWCQVSAGGSHTAAIRTNGALWTWGENSFGQLGDNTIVSKSSPVSASAASNSWYQVSAGHSHTMGIIGKRF